MIKFIPSKGTIVYDDFNIDFTKSITTQADSLKEDLLQISFAENMILDLGWYPEYNIRGKFVLQIIKNYDWENPIYKETINYSSDIYKKINDAINTIL